MNQEQLNFKLIGSLLTMALISFAVFVFAIIYSVTPARAQEIVFENAVIEDGSLKPLAFSVGVNAGVDVSSDTSVDNSTSSSKSEEKVDTHEESAQLFGFIPTTLKVNTEIDAQGNVKTHYPWYAFLFAKTGVQK